MASAFAKQTAPWPWSKSAPASVTNVRNRSRPPRNLRVVSPVGSVTGWLAGRRLSGKETPVALEDKFDELSARIDELVATLRRLESLGRERTTVGAASEPCAVERPAVPDSLVPSPRRLRSEEHTSELQSLAYLVCRLLLEKKKKKRRRRSCSTSIESQAE